MRIGSLYPKVKCCPRIRQRPADVEGVRRKGTDDYRMAVGNKDGRMSKSPRAWRPLLVRSFLLANKKNKATHLEIVVDDSRRFVRFVVVDGNRAVPESTVTRNGGRCLCCGTVFGLDHIRQSGKDKKIGAIDGNCLRGQKWTCLFAIFGGKHDSCSEHDSATGRPRPNFPLKLSGFACRITGLLSTASFSQFGNVSRFQHFATSSARFLYGQRRTRYSEAWRYRRSLPMQWV